MAQHAAHAMPPSDKPSGSGRKSANSRLWTVIMWVAIIVFVAALIFLGANLYTYWSDNNRYTDIAEEVANVEDRSLANMTVDWETLQEINPDIVGWIYIPGTNINYPVVQGGDNEEYLSKNFDGATSLLTGCGTIFMDASNDSDIVDDNTFLYGHHRQDGTMFAALSDLADQDAFDESRDVYYLTPSENYHMTTFALVRTTGSDKIVQTNFSSRSDFKEYLQDKMDRSLVTPSEGMPDLSSIEQIFSLATCDYNEDDGRAVLFAVIDESVVPNSDASNVVGEYEQATE